MANGLVQKQTLQDIANAIRNKNQEVTTYKPSEMAAAINAIASDPKDIALDGNSYQYTTSGKNLFNKEVGMSIGGASKTTLPTGVRITQTTAGTYKNVYFLFGQSELLGKSITLHSNITASASNNGGILVWFGNSSNPYVQRIGMLTSSGSTTINIPSSFASSTDRIMINFYSNRDATGNVNDYVDYTDLQIELGSSYTGYEDYTGGTASPNPDYPQEVEVVEGKNMITTFYDRGERYISYNIDNTKLTNTITYSFIPNFNLTNVDVIIRTISNAGIYSKGRVNLVQNTRATFTMELTNEELQTLKSSSSIVQIYKSGSNFDGYEITNVQLEEGTTASEYVPYNNIEVNVVGKNLFNNNSTPAYLNTTTTQKINTGIRAIDTAGSENNHFALFKVLDVSNYVGKTFSIKMQFQASGTNQGQFVVGLCDENGGNRIASKWGTTSGQEVSFTIPTLTTSNYMAIWLYSNASGTSTANDYVDYTNIMINEGSTALPYEPYSNITIPVPLNNGFIGKINDYKDILNIDLDNGIVSKLKNIGKVVLDGSETNWSDWGITQTSTIGAKLSNVYNMIYIRNTDTANVVVSNYFTKATNQDTLYSQDNEGFATTEGNLYFRINKTAASSLANLKVWLSTHNTIIYYVLETPTAEALTTIDQTTLTEFKNTLKNGGTLTIYSNLDPSQIRITYGYTKTL